MNILSRCNSFHCTKTYHAIALPYVLIVMTVVSIILVGIITLTASQIRYSSNQVGREQAFRVAETGVNFYHWYVSNTTAGMTAQQTETFWADPSTLGVVTPYVAQVTDTGGTVVGEYSVSVTPPIPGSNSFVVESTGTTSLVTNAQPRVVRVRMRRPSWSEFAVLSDSPLYFDELAYVDGKIFSNDGIHFDGVATGTVSSAVATYFDDDSSSTQPGVWTEWAGEYNTTQSSDVFLAGKFFPVAAKDFESVKADLNLMKSVAQSGNGVYFDNSGKGRHIILRTDGTMDVSTVQNANGFTHNITSESAFTNYTIPNNGVVFVENDAWVEGQVDGVHVTIAAANLTSSADRDIFIGEDILYTNYDGTDSIGIVSQRDIEIYRDSADDLRIDAALIAQEGRVGRSYYAGSCPCGNSTCIEPKNQIYFYGAIVTGENFGFSWKDSCPRDTGYIVQQFDYDNFLLYNPPPYFPTQGTYVIDLWEEL